MKKILAITLLLGLVAMAWTPAPDNKTAITPSFQSGEFLLFRLHYGFIDAGFAEMEVAPEPVVEKGRRCYHIVGRGYTNPTFDVFYKVRDVYESYLDQEKLVSLRFNRSIREGKFESYSETHFDHQKHQARYIDDKKNESIFEIQPGIQDVISAFYIARTRYDHTQLKPGDRISMRNFIDRKTVGLEAELIEREVTKISGQKYKALKMALLVEESGMITDGSKITFWITDDANKIPLRIKSKLVIGSLKADLIAHENLRYPLTSLVD